MTCKSCMSLMDLFSKDNDREFLLRQRSFLREAGENVFLNVTFSTDVFQLVAPNSHYLRAINISFYVS